MTVVSAWLRSRHLIAVAAICTAVALVGVFAVDGDLRLPGIRRSLPVPLLMVLISALAVTTPLCNRFGGLEASLPRARLDRTLAGSLACGFAILACVPISAAAPSRFHWTPMLAAMIVGVLAVILLGPLAWLPPSVLSLVTIYVDFNYNDPIRSSLDAVGIPLLLAALVLALYAYVVLGPRRS